MNDLAIHDESKNDAFSRILQFYQTGDIVLTAAEETILKRWNHCDALIRSRKFKTDDIIEKMRDLFGISKFTAQNDIRQTHAFFGQTRVISKAYILSHHIEEIQLTIERIKFDKSLSHLLPKLYAELTRATAALPDETAKPPAQAPVVNIGTAVITSTLSVDEAKEKLKQRKAQKENDEYTDFEDVSK